MAMEYTYNEHYMAIVRRGMDIVRYGMVIAQALYVNRMAVEWGPASAL